jgi:hypothetical protein
MASRREKITLDLSNFCLWKLPEEGDCGDNDTDDVVMAKQRFNIQHGPPLVNIRQALY